MIRSPFARTIIPIATLVVLSGCPEDKGGTVWPNETTNPTVVTSTAEDERVDLYGDRLPSGSIARLGSVRMLDFKLGRAIFSADGTEIITSSEEAYLVWGATTAQRIETLDVAAAAPAMAIQADGKRLATALYGGGIQLWDYPAKKRGAVLSGHRKTVTALCFAGDTLISGGEDSTLRTWAEGGGKSLTGAWHEISAVHCRANGTVLFADHAGSVWLTDASGAEPTRLDFDRKKPTAGKAITALAMASGTGPYVAAVADGTIAVWDNAKDTPRRFDAHAHRVLSVAFLPDGRLLSSGGDSYFRTWNVATGEKLEERKGAEDVEAQLFELSSNGAFIVGSSELKDGRASEAGRFWLYDGTTGAQLLEPDRHHKDVTALAFSPDGKMVISAGDDGKVFAWNVADATRAQVLSKQKGAVRAIGFDGKKNLWFSVGYDARMHASSLGGADSIILDPLGGAIHALAVEPNGNRLVVGDFAGKVTSFSRATGQKLARHDSEAFTTIYALAFSPDGKTFAIAGGNRYIHIISAATGKKLTMLAPEDVVANHTLAFSPDGKFLASGGDDHLVRIWNASIWKELAQLEGHDGTVRAVAFSADSKRLASGSSDEVVRLWDVVRRTEITLLAGHRGAVTSVAFSPDGKLLASGSNDRTALIWELAAEPIAADSDAKKDGAP